MKFSEPIVLARTPNVSANKQIRRTSYASLFSYKRYMDHREGDTRLTNLAVTSVTAFEQTTVSTYYIRHT